MAVDLSAQAPPRQCMRVALDGTADNLTQVTLPEWATAVTVTFKQNNDSTDDSGFITFAGTDGATKGNNWFPIASGGAYTYAINAPDDNSVIYLAAATNTAFAHLMFERS